MSQHRIMTMVVAALVVGGCVGPYKSVKMSKQGDPCAQFVSEYLESSGADRARVFGEADERCQELVMSATRAVRVDLDAGSVSWTEGCRQASTETQRTIGGELGRAAAGYAQWDAGHK